MKIWAPLTILITIAALAVGSVWLIKYSPNKFPVASTLPSQQNTNPPTQNLETVQVNLSLKPEFTQVTVGQEFIVAINVSSGNLGVTGVEANFNYDPKSIDIISVEPGTYIQQPVILDKSINPNIGKITYAIAKQPTTAYAKGAGNVFNIKVKALKATQLNNNILVFDRTNTKIALASLEKDYRYSPEETVVIYSEEPLVITSAK
jgi:hypothetical protein